MKNTDESTFMSRNNKSVDGATKKYAQQQAVQSTPEGEDPRKELVEYLPLVKYIAGRLAIGLPRSVEMDDLINAGVVGLIEAYRNFDIGKGVKFETYASLRIRGSILDELRGMDWVPRSTRARSREVERTLSKLEGELKLAILKKAALFEREDFKKFKETKGKDRAKSLIKKK